MTAEQAFMWYAFSLGFAIPVGAISVFYFQVVVRLGKVSAVQQTKGMDDNFTSSTHIGESGAE